MIEIGKFQISRVEEVVLDEDPSLLEQFDHDVLARHRDLLVPDFFNPERNCFRTMIHAWILRTPDKTIVIDTAGGDDKDRPLSPRFHMKKTGFDTRLAAAGVDPEDVDLVLLTHLHVDHVGWNTKLQDGAWVPMFPNAEYVATRTELEVRDPERGARDRPEASWGPYLDSVKPILDAGMMRIVEGDETLMPGIDFVPLPGHAPGMMGIRVRDDGKEAFFIADAMHQPIQIHYPGWSSKYCENRDLATETRANIFRHAADEGALLLPAHFCGPMCGYVRPTSDGYAFEPPAVHP
ncbi:MBL fold metallo-hydrolase [Microbaculum marinum]|uniref:MBL fold metallo-hydrolase n=1 Tax=Microbaculum marinum TaxID=1764581 RepID=A0AAW9RZI6_9HYPH